MKRFQILIILSAISIVSSAQSSLNIYAGTAFAKCWYGGHWKNSFNTKANTGRVFGSDMEIPLSKKLILHSSVEMADKKFTYTSGVPSAIQFKRTEECRYVGLKSALHVSLFTKNNVTITAGAGIFGSAAVKGFYTEKRTDSFGPAYSPKGSLKIGNSPGNSYKKFDAGVTVQVMGRYKNFSLLITDDLSFTSNLPKQYYTDAYGMPLAAAPVKRKWRSLLAGIGWCFQLKKKK